MRSIYSLLITIAAAAAAGRIMAAGLVYEPWLFREENNSEDQRRIWPKSRPAPMPTFSSNDRSRWATVRALVDEGTYVIGRRDAAAADEDNQYGDHGIIFEDGYQSVDKVLDPQTQIFYSSKPPLLATLAAGEYWLLKRAFGWTMTENPFLIVDTVLFTFNWLPFVVYLIVLARLVERYGLTEWGKMFVLAAACFGTLLTPFLITLNNHTLGACSTLFAIGPALAIWSKKEGSIGQFLLSGFFAGFTASIELPGTAFAAGLLFFLFLRVPQRTLMVALPAALLPVTAFFTTNHLAVGEWMPIYSKFGTEWYEYDGSHWKVPEGTVKPGIDFLNEPKRVYALHLLVGHHGLVSLTPIFLLTLPGFLVGRRKRPSLSDAEAWSGDWATARALPVFLPLLTAVLTIIVIAFYIKTTNNYGGWTSGPRWLIWLTPLWLLTMLPVVDRLAAWRIGRAFAYLLLAVSVLSATYPAVNPWRHPWIYNLLEARGWLQY